jgi:sugar lactone lactonase YvrE
LTQLEVISDARALNAESPVWSEREGSIYWIDTRGARIFRVHLGSGRRDSWETPAKIGAIALRRGGGLLASMKSGIASLDTATGAYDFIVDPEPDRPEGRPNDGKTDRSGRYWFGTVEEEGAKPGRLYRFGADRAAAKVDEGFTFVNGIAWSPDDRRMYVGDTFGGTIYAYDFDLPSGEARNRRAFATVPKDDGIPDGMTVDAQGYVWGARPDAWKVVRYAPDGGVDRELPFPFRRPTSVIFGGDDLRTLFVTSASFRHSEEELAAQPLAGHVVAVRVDVPGLAEPEFVD